MMKSQRSDTEKINLIEEGKKIGIDEVIKHNEIINNRLKSQSKTMSSYCLKCEKNTENVNPRVSKTINGKTRLFQKLLMVKQGHYQNVQYVVVKNQDLLKNKKQVEY